MYAYTVIVWVLVSVCKKRTNIQCRSCGLLKQLTQFWLVTIAHVVLNSNPYYILYIVSTQDSYYMPMIIHLINSEGRFSINQNFEKISMDMCSQWVWFFSTGCNDVTPRELWLSILCMHMGCVFIVWSHSCVKYRLIDWEGTVRLSRLRTKREFLLHSSFCCSAFAFEIVALIARPRVDIVVWIVRMYFHYGIQDHLHHYNLRVSLIEVTNRPSLVSVHHQEKRNSASVLWWHEGGGKDNDGWVCIG